MVTEADCMVYNSSRQQNISSNISMHRGQKGTEGKYHGKALKCVECTCKSVTPYAYIWQHWHRNWSRCSNSPPSMSCQERRSLGILLHNNYTGMCAYCKYECTSILHSEWGVCFRIVVQVYVPKSATMYMHTSLHLQKTI